MALIVIKIRDDEDDGKVNVSLESEPPFDTTDDGVNTSAQVLAFRMLEAAMTENDHGTPEVT